MKKDTKQKLMAGAGCVLIAGASAIAGANIFPKEVISEVEVEKLVPEIVEVEVAVEKIVTETIEVEVEKIVEVDNGNLDAVIDWVQDEVDEDIDTDYIIFEVDAKIEAEALIRDEMISMLDDEDQFDNGEAFDDYRKSEVSIKKIYDAVVVSRDFEDKDLELTYQVKMKAQEDGEDKEYVYYEVSVPFVDGQLDRDDVEVSLI